MIRPSISGGDILDIFWPIPKWISTVSGHFLWKRRRWDCWRRLTSRQEHNLHGRCAAWVTRFPRWESEVELQCGSCCLRCPNGSFKAGIWLCRSCGNGAQKGRGTDEIESSHLSHSHHAIMPCTTLLSCYRNVGGVPRACSECSVHRISDKSFCFSSTADQSRVQPLVKIQTNHWIQFRIAVVAIHYADVFWFQKRCFFNVKTRGFQVVFSHSHAGLSENRVPHSISWLNTWFSELHFFLG